MTRMLAASVTLCAALAAPVSSASAGDSEHAGLDVRIASVAQETGEDLSDAQGDDEVAPDLPWSTVPS